TSSTIASSPSRDPGRPQPAAPRQRQPREIPECHAPAIGRVALRPIAHSFLALAAMHQETTMTNTSARRGRRGTLLFLSGGLVAVWALLCMSAVADDRERITAPNYKAAAQYSNTFLR